MDLYDVLYLSRGFFFSVWIAHDWATGRFRVNVLFYVNLLLNFNQACHIYIYRNNPKGGETLINIKEEHSKGIYNLIRNGNRKQLYRKYIPLKPS